MKLVDKNQREFDVDLSQLCDMASTLPWMDLTDSVQKPPVVPKIEIIDEDGQPVNGVSLMDAATAEGKRTVIDVTLEATHSGRNHNYFNYDSAELERGAHTWKTPFPKPMLKNHDMRTEPIGRVQDFKFGPSTLTDERDCITVTFRVSDQDAVAKFLDGRYQTMSIGANSNHITCGICGKDILKDEEFKFCGHMRGEKYKGETAYWTAKDFTYKEGSVVNNPADDWAQVTRIQVVSDEEGVKDEADTPPVTDEQPGTAAELNDSQEDEAGLIDSILDGKEPGDETPPATNPVEDHETPPTTPTLEDLQTQIKSLEDSVRVKEEEAQAQAKTIADLETTIQSDTQTLTDMKKQSTSLAVMNKRLLVDLVLGRECGGNALTDEAKEARRQALSVMKASELSDLLKTLPEPSQTQRRNPTPKVANPGLVDNEKEKNVVGSKKGTVKDDKKTANQPTMKDLTDAFVDMLTRQC